MPDYGHGIKDQDRTSTSYLASLRRWLQIKKYQYEVTFSLYMLTPTEKFVFNMIILVLLSLLVTAAVAYLPNHLVVISNRLWYYVHGEFLFPKNGNHGHGSGSAVEAVKSLISTTGRGGVVRETVEAVVGRGRKEL